MGEALLDQFVLQISRTLREMGLQRMASIVYFSHLGVQALELLAQRTADTHMHAEILGQHFAAPEGSAHLALRVLKSQLLCVLGTAKATARHRVALLLRGQLVELTRHRVVGFLDLPEGAFQVGQRNLRLCCMACVCLAFPHITCPLPLCKAQLLHQQPQDTCLRLQCHTARLCLVECFLRLGLHIGKLCLVATPLILGDRQSTVQLIVFGSCQIHRFVHGQDLHVIF
mmetsp:Transcript_20980/g.55970  ORF Transcript_20980/g.55970 Transcript_20980/m.55970 type:complete len:228 (-) Transcript_20980:694-1377(-)